MKRNKKFKTTKKNKPLSWFMRMLGKGLVVDGKHRRQRTVSPKAKAKRKERQRMAKVSRKKNRR